MNASRPVRSASATARPYAPARGQVAPGGRQFGTGYGRSSGYAAPRRYTPTSALPQFRVA